MVGKLKSASGMAEFEALHGAVNVAMLLQASRVVGSCYCFGVVPMVAPVAAAVSV